MPPFMVIGRRMASLSASSYVHRDLLDPENPEDVSHLSWIGKSPEGQKQEYEPGNPVLDLLCNDADTI